MHILSYPSGFSSLANIDIKVGSTSNMANGLDIATWKTFKLTPFKQD